MVLTLVIVIKNLQEKNAIQQIECIFSYLSHLACMYSKKYVDVSVKSVFPLPFVLMPRNPFAT